jgi:hypothetical protein
MDGFLFLGQWSMVSGFRFSPTVGIISVSGGRQPIGALSLRVFFLPPVDFADSDIENPSRKWAGQRKTGGLTPRRSPLWIQSRGFFN